jgi:thymidylate kinase
MPDSFSPEEVVAAYLADPLRAPKRALPWSTCNAGRVVAILQQNKVPLLSVMESEQNAPLVGDLVFQSARRAEEQHWTGLRTEYAQVKQGLASQGIRDVMIKSVGLSPSFPYRSDNLDVLYRQRDVDQVRATLLDMGYVELKNVEEPLKYLFRKFHAGSSVSAIHLHAHVGWMVSFLDEDTLWQRCSESDDDPLVTVPAAEDALLTTLAHYFYEDKRVALLDVLKFAHCLRRGVNWDEVYRVATWRGWRDGLNVSLLLCAYQERVLYGETLTPLEVLQQAVHELPDWTWTLFRRWLGSEAMADLSLGRPAADGAGVKEMPLRIPFAFSKVFFYTKLARDPTRSVGRRLKDLAVHTANGSKLRLRIHSQPRMLITLSGVDGCGKTTQAEMLQSAFEVCHLRADRVWSRAGSARWLQLFTRWGKKRPVMNQVSRDAMQGQQVDKFELRKQRFRSPWMRWGWSWLTTLELLLRYACQVTLPLLLGRVVICDRYIQDTLADWAAYFGEPTIERRLAAKILRWLTPRPRIAYWLDVPADVAQARSAEPLPASLLRDQSGAFSRLSALWGLARLDGSRDRAELSDEIVHQVLSAYFSDYHTVINTLFLKNPGQWR